MGGPQQGPYFLSRLLDDEIPNPITCTRKMQLVGFAPLPALYVVCLLKKDAQLEARDAESIRGQLQPLLHHSLITMYEGELVALVSRPPSTQLPAADEAILARVATANNLFIGISNAFSQATDVRSHLNQARAAIRYGSTFTKILEDTHVYRYCEYTYMEMLDICNDHINLMNYSPSGNLGTLETRPVARFRAGRDALCLYATQLQHGAHRRDLVASQKHAALPH